MQSFNQSLYLLREVILLQANAIGAQAQPLPLASDDGTVAPEDFMIAIWTHDKRLKIDCLRAPGDPRSVTVRAQSSIPGSDGISAQVRFVFEPSNTIPWVDYSFRELTETQVALQMLDLLR